eukprot:10365670-Alexandrium_andersonii.AAC.1
MEAPRQDRERKRGRSAGPHGLRTCNVRQPKARGACEQQAGRSVRVRLCTGKHCAQALGVLRAPPCASCS